MVRKLGTESCKSAKVSVCVDGKRLLATIDTAAQVTVMKREIWANLGLSGGEEHNSHSGRRE